VRLRFERELTATPPGRKPRCAASIAPEARRAAIRPALKILTRRVKMDATTA